MQREREHRGAAGQLQSTDEHRPGRLIRTGLALLSATGLTWISSLVMLAVMPRAVSPAEFGVYATATVAVGIASLLATCGMSQVVIRSVARSPERAASIVAQAVVARAVLWGVVLALAAPLATTMFPAGEARLVLALVALRSVIGSSGAVAVEGLHGLQALGRFAILRALLAGATELAGAALLLGGWGVVAFVLLGTGSATLRAAVAWAMFARRSTGSWGVNARALRALPGAGLPFLTVDLALVLYGGVGALILAQVLGAPAVGPFALASRIASVVTTTPSIVAGAVLPALAAAHLERERFVPILRDAIRVVVAGTVPMGVGLALLAPDVVDLFTGGTGYDSAVPILRISALALPLIGLDVVLGTAITSLNRQRAWAVTTAVMAAASFPLTYAAVLYSGAALGNGGVGAAAAPAALEFVMCVVALRLLRGAVDVGALLTTISRAAVSVLAMSVGVLATASAAGPFAAIGVGAVIYCVVALMSGLVSPADLGHLHEAVRVRGRGRLPVPIQAE